MEEQARSARQMVSMLLSDSALLEKLKVDPAPVLKEAADRAEAATPAYIRDKWLYRTAVGVLGLLALLAAVGSIILVLGGRTTPEVLVSLGSAAVGALVGLFAPSPTSR